MGVKQSKLTKHLTDERMSEDVAYAMAIDASIRTASEEGVLVSPSARQQSGDSNGWGDSTAESSYSGWGPNEQKKPSPIHDIAYGGWEGEQPSTYDGWGSPDAGPSRQGSGDSSKIPTSKPPDPSLPSPGDVNSVNISSIATSPPSFSAPSAPPLPSDYLPPGTEFGGPIQYPSIDTSPVQVNYPSPLSSAVAVKESEKKPEAGKQDSVVGQCVVCWDAPAQAVCIPCGHLAGCMECLSEIKEKSWGCPVCRAPLQQVVKVFQV